MLTQEEWEAQKRARRLVQLTAARNRKKELAEIDKQAVQQGLPKPSLINKAMKKHPLLVDAQGRLQQGFNAKDWFRNQIVTIPLIELLSLSPEYNQQTKEALGYANVRSANHNIQVQGIYKTTSQIAGADDEVYDSHLDPEARNAPQVTSGTSREVNVMITDVVGVRDKEQLYTVLTNTFNKVVTEGGVPLQVVQLGIADKDYDALIDPGASVSIIPLTLLKEMGLENQVKPIKDISLSFAGQKTAKPIGIIKDLTLLFSSELEVIHSFVVVDFADFPLILGMDFMHGAKASMDPSRQELIFDIMEDDNSNITKEQLIIDTIPGTGLNTLSQPRRNDMTNSRHLNSTIMNIKMVKGASDQQLLMLTNDIQIEPQSVMIANIQCYEPTLMHNINEPLIMVPSQAALSSGLTVCPTIIHPARIFETVIGNISQESTILRANQAIGILVSARVKTL